MAKLPEKRGERVCTHRCLAQLLSSEELHCSWGRLCLWYVPEAPRVLLTSLVTQLWRVEMGKNNLPKLSSNLPVREMHVPLFILNT